MKDRYGDTIRVQTVGSDLVYVIFENDDEYIDMSLTVAQVRKLIRKLEAAAHDAEVERR